VSTLCLCCRFPWVTVDQNFILLLSIAFRSILWERRHSLLHYQSGYDLWYLRSFRWSKLQIHNRILLSLLVTKVTQNCINSFQETSESNWPLDEKQFACWMTW